MRAKPTITQNNRILPLALALAALVLSPSSVHQAEAAGFVSVSPMNIARSSHTATLLPNGKVLVAGGFADNATAFSAELYDPATDTWSVTGSMKFGGWSATLLPNGKVLVAGGSNTSTSAELYDPATGTWTLTGSLHNPFDNYSAATLLPNGKVLLVRGAVSSELYDPVDGTWTATGRDVSGPLTLLPNGKVLAVGTLYDPATGTWTTTGGGGLDTATLLFNGKVLGAGGYTFTATLYDPESGTSSATGSLAWRRDFGCTATLLRNGQALVAGGLWNVQLHMAIPSAELYDPATGTWTEIAMNGGRFWHTATLLPNGKVLVAGGLDTITPGGGIRQLSSAEIYQPDNEVPLVILITPGSQSAPAGATVTLPVVAAGPNPLFYQWYFNSTSLPGATNSTLTLSNVTFQESGGYHVVVTNSLGPVTSPTARLDVVPLLITSQTANTNVRSGLNAVLGVGVTSTVPVSCQWRFNGADILHATNLTLGITNVQLAHEGEYTAVLVNSFGSVTSPPTRLSVLVTPVIVQPPLSQAVAPGGTASFSVEISGHPPPFTYEWRRLTSPAFTNRFDSVERISFFALTNVQSDSTGSYRVVVRNPASPSGVSPGVFTLSLLTDTDSDGMPDAWESTNGLNAAVNDAALDADGDGSSNRDEYIAGTDSTDRFSYLAVGLNQADGVAEIHFGAVSNKTYSILRSDTPGGAWGKLADVLARPTNRVEKLQDAPGPTARFYRVVTPRQP